MAKMHPMVDMAISEEDRADMGIPMAMPVSDGPRYPYELRITLTEKELEKLDLDAGEAFVGGVIHLHALARVTSVSANETDRGLCHRIELQIEDLCVESEDEENEEEE